MKYFITFAIECTLKLFNNTIIMNNIFVKTNAEEIV